MQQHELEILLDQMSRKFIRPGDVVSFQDEGVESFATVMIVQFDDDPVIQILERVILTILPHNETTWIFRFWHEVKRVGSFTRTPGIPSTHPCETETD